LTKLLKQSQNAFISFLLTKSPIHRTQSFNTFETCHNNTNAHISLHVL